MNTLLSVLYKWLSQAVLFFFFTVPYGALAVTISPASGHEEAAKLSCAIELMIEMQYPNTVSTVLESQRRLVTHRVDDAIASIPREDFSKAQADDYKARALCEWAKTLAPDLIVRSMAEIYARNFTIEELKALTAFYRTSAGKALIARSTEIQHTSTALFFSKLQTAMGTVLKMDDDLRRIHDAPKSSSHAGYSPDLTDAPRASRKLSPLGEATH